jgi:hypothetical protein
MAANLWHTASSNAFNTTLNGNIASGDTTITLTSVTNLSTTNGVLVIDRQDVNGNDTPSLREYVSYTGVSGSQITGVTRGLGGSTAQAHNSAAKVEECFSVSHWNDLLTALLNVLTSAGALDTTKVADLSSSQSLSNKTLTSPTLSGTVAGSPTFGGKPIFTATQPTLVADSDGSTVTFDMSAGNVHRVTLGGNRTLATTNVGTPQAFVIMLKQDGTGSRTVTWFSGILWAQGTTPTLTTSASKTDIFGFIYDGTNYFGTTIGQNH